MFKGAFDRSVHASVQPATRTGGGANDPCNATRRGGGGRVARLARIEHAARGRTNESGRGGGGGRRAWEGVTAERKEWVGGRRRSIEMVCSRVLLRGRSGEGDFA